MASLDKFVEDDLRGRRAAVERSADLWRTWSASMREMAELMVWAIFEQRSVTAAAERPADDDWQLQEPEMAAAAALALAVERWRRNSIPAIERSRDAVTSAYTNELAESGWSVQGVREAVRAMPSDAPLSRISEIVLGSMNRSRSQGFGVDRTARMVRVALIGESQVVGLEAAQLDSTTIVNLASSTTASMSGVVGRKQWLATNDLRVRPTHRAAAGQTVPIEQPFLVGGESGMFPGDPSFSAKERVNCRCTLIYPDEDGKLPYLRRAKALLAPDQEPVPGSTPVELIPQSVPIGPIIPESSV